MKLEGFCPQIDTTNSINFRYHIAGFGGCDPASPTVNNLKKITIPFTSSVAIQKTTTPEVHIKVDASKIFNGVTPWEVSKHTNVMSLNKESQTISDNYATMFSLKEIH